MAYKNVELEVSKCFESPTNPRGVLFDKTEQTELVASIKQKGVLMPVLARLSKDGKYEIIAGNRRLRAAKEAGLAWIPARIVDMSDEEVREAQIVENLQRADVPPIDEAYAFADLLKTQTAEEIAAKVGKDTRYVRNRLALSTLDKKYGDKVRSGALPVAHAVVIGRLEKEQQAEAVKFTMRGNEAGDLADLKEYVASLLFTEAMKSPPWENDAAAKAEIARVTGLKGGEKNLFDEEAAVKIDNPADYARAMAAHIQIKIKEYDEKKRPLVLVSGEYTTKSKDLIGRDNYETGKGFYGKKQCAFLENALIVEGRGVGTIIKICRNKACPAHHYQPSAGTPEAKAKASKERNAEKRRREKDAAEVAKAIAKVVWPMTEKQLDVLLGLAVNRAWNDAHRQVCKRREIDPIMKSGHRDWDGALLKAAKAMPLKDRLGVVFEVLLFPYPPHSSGRVDKIKGL